MSKVPDQRATARDAFDRGIIEQEQEGKYHAASAGVSTAV
jgi:hypothetical protein